MKSNWLRVAAVVLLTAMAGMGAAATVSPTSGGNSDSYDKYKPVNVTDTNDPGATISKAQPVVWTCGDDSTTGTGDIVIDCSNIDGTEDIDFSDSNNDRLDYEIESFDSTSGGVAWVYNDWTRDDSEQLRVHYGTGSTDEQDVTGTWGNTGQNADHVYHHDNDPLQAENSVTGGTGTVSGPSSISNFYNGAGYYDGSDYILGDGNVDYGTGAFTALMYINPENYEQVSGDADAVGNFDSGGWILGLADGSAEWRAYFNGGPDLTGGNPNNNEDFLVVMTRDSSGNVNIFEDGSSVASASGSSGNVDSGAGNDITIGMRSNLEGDKSTQGDIDEVRTYGDGKSSDWVQAEYDASPKAGQTFFTQQAGTTSNQAPDTPTNPSPADTATGVSTTTDLSVDVTDPDGDTMDVSFYWDNGTLIETVNSVASGGTATTSSLSLEFGTTYNWYAVADDGSATTTSSTWSFTTNAAPTFDSTSITPDPPGYGDSVDASYTVSDPDNNFDNVAATAYKDGSQINTASSTSTSDTFTSFYTVDETGSDYDVKYVATDTAGASNTEWINRTVTQYPPSIDSKSVTPDPPLIGEYVNYSGTFSDQNQNHLDNATLTVFDDGSQVYTDTASLSGSSDSVDWNQVYQATEGSLDAKFTVKDKDGASTYEWLNRTLTDDPPTVTVHDPDTTAYSSAPDFNFSASDSDSNPDETFNWTVTSNGNSIDTGTGTEPLVYVTGSISNTQEGSNTLEATVSDPAVQTGSDSVSWTLDTTPPTTTDDWTASGWQAQSSASVTLTCSDTTTSCDYIEYQVDSNGWNQVSGSSTTVSISGDGNHTLEYRSNDTVGNLETTNTEYVALDSTSPSISFNADTTGSGTYSRDWIYVDVSATDNLDLDTVTEEFGGGNSSFDSSSGSDYWTNHTALADGTYTFTGYASDSAGNTDSTSSRTVTLDTTPPSLSIYEPAGNFTSKTGIPLEYTASDANLDSCSYSVDGGANTTLSSCGNTTFSVSKVGDHTLDLYASDTAGNTQHESSTFFADHENDITLEDQETSTTIQDFQVTMSNGTDTFGDSTSTGVFKWNTSEMPYGDVDVTLKAAGYDTETVTYSGVDGTFEKSATYQMEPAGFTAQIYDEQSGGKLGFPRKVTLTNSTETWSYHWGQRYESVTAATGSVSTPSAAWDGDNNTALEESTSNDVQGQTIGYVAVKEGNNTLNILAYTDDPGGGYGAWEVTAYGERDGSWNKLGSTPLPQQKTVTSFDFTNNGGYNGRIKIEYSMSGDNDNIPLDLYEIWTNNQEGQPPEFDYANAPVTGDVTVKADDTAGIYNVRDYFVTIDQYSSIDLDAYLLREGEGSYTNIEVVGEDGESLEGSTVTIRKLIDSNYQTVSQSETGTDGTTSFYLDPDISYQATASHPSYEPFTGTFNPSNYQLEPLTIQLAPDSVYTMSTVWDQVGYYLTPQNQTIPSEPTNFTWSVEDPEGGLSSTTLEVTDSNDTVLGTDSLSSPSGGEIILGVNLSNQSNGEEVTARGMFTRNGTTYNYTRVYTIRDELTPGDNSLVKIFQLVEDNTGSETQTMIALIMTLFASVSLGTRLGKEGAGVIALTVLGAFTVMGWVNGFIFLASLLAVIGINATR